MICIYLVTFDFKVIFIIVLIKQKKIKEFMYLGF